MSCSSFPFLPLPPLLLPSFFYILYIVLTGAHLPQSAWRLPETTYGSQFFLSSKWVPETGLMLSGLVSRVSMNWAILMAPWLILRSLITRQFACKNSAWPHLVFISIISMSFMSSSSFVGTIYEIIIGNTVINLVSIFPLLSNTTKIYIIHRTELCWTVWTDAKTLTVHVLKLVAQAK